MNETSNLIYFCNVLSVIDDKEGLRIKVRIPYLDDSKTPVSELPYVFPLLPKFVHVNPKKDEMVLVVLQTINGAQSNRFFIGPVISQPQKLDFDAYAYSAQSLFTGNQIAKPLPAPSLDPDNNGTLPDREDIAIQGRGNSDMVLKPTELRLRCGFKQNSTANKEDCLKFNKVDIGYIQMKYNHMKDHKNNDFSSIINIVADRINLLSHDSRDYFNLTDPDSLIKDEELKKIFENAHQLPYGDKLIDFLKEFIRIFLNHTHPFSMDKPCLNEPDLEKLTTKSHLDEMLSNSIRIN